MRPPHFLAARNFIDNALGELSRAAASLKLPGDKPGTRQHPTYYRANQFWRQLDEFRSELERAAGVPSARPPT